MQVQWIFVGPDVWSTWSHSSIAKHWILWLRIHYCPCKNVQMIFRGCEWVTEKQGLAFLTGRIGLPMLAFKAVATADLDDVEFLAVLSCFIGKLFVYLLACAASWVAFKGSHSNALISMAIFSFHVTAANDFVFGIPIMQAFYPTTGMTNLVANAVVQNCFFQVCSLSVLGVGTATAQQPGGSNISVNASTERQSVRILKQLVQDPLLCAILTAVQSSVEVFMMFQAHASWFSTTQQIPTGARTPPLIKNNKDPYWRNTEKGRAFISCRFGGASHDLFLPIEIIYAALCLQVHHPQCCLFCRVVSFVWCRRSVLCIGSHL